MHLAHQYMGEIKKCLFPYPIMLTFLYQFMQHQKNPNELMAHSYNHLFGLKSTGLRFFTVYGPWGRPDMAMYIFTKKY